MTPPHLQGKPMTPQIYLGLQEIEPPQIRDYACKKPNCWHCQITAPKPPRPEVVMKPIYAFAPTWQRRWAVKDSAILAANLHLHSNEILDLFPNRTVHAIANQMWRLRKERGLKPPPRRRNGEGFV